MPADLNAQRVDLLEPDSLLRLYSLYEEVATPLDAYFRSVPQSGDGLGVQWETLEFSREAAAVNTRAGDPNPVKPAARATITASPLSISESIYVPPDVLADLRAPGETARANGAIWVGIQMRQLRNRLLRRRQILKAHCLGANATHPGYMDFREPGKSTDTSVNLDFTSTHITIGTAWQTSTTNILADMDAAKLKIRQHSGRNPTTMLTTSTVMGYITANDSIYAWMSDAAKDEVRLTNRVRRLAELDIVVVDDQYDTDGAGTMAGLFPDDFVCILPADATYREERECKPVSPHAPNGSRGLFMHTWYDAGIKGGAHIEYEWTGLPVVVVPDEIVFDVDVTA